LGCIALPNEAAERFGRNSRLGANDERVGQATNRSEKRVTDTIFTFWLLSLGVVHPSPLTYFSDAPMEDKRNIYLSGRTMLRETKRRHSCQRRVISSIAHALVAWVTILRIDVVSSDIPPARLETFIDLATSYLVRISHTSDQDPKNPGAFTYLAHIGEDLQLDGFDIHPQQSYNLLRHNGAIYSLSQAYNRKADARVKAAILRGVSYLKTTGIGPVPDVEEGGGSVLQDMLAPWENIRQGDQHENPPMRAKLGGAGLSLIALCSTERIAPGTTDLEYLRKIGNFIHYLQKEDGSLVSRFDSRNGKDDTWASLYYPGEAALGLIYLFELETDEKMKKQWLQIATQTLLYLEELRRFKPFMEIEPDHWALLATARLLPYMDDNSGAYWLVYEHAMKVIRSMLASISQQELEENHGCFSRDRRTCPTATRLEGLLASLSVVKDHEIFIDVNTQKVAPLRDIMVRYIEIGVDFLLDAQQTEEANNMKGAIPARSPIIKDVDSAVRVDYVQHCMSAVIAYEALRRGSGQTYGWAFAKFALFVGSFIALCIVILLLLPDRVTKSRRYHE
jgi:hypothetical protein